MDQSASLIRWYSISLSVLLENYETTDSKLLDTGILCSKTMFFCYLPDTVCSLSSHQFHFNIKMEYARNELKQGRKTPVELSHELEYSHPSNFTSAYKNYFNVVPSSDFVKG